MRIQPSQGHNVAFWCFQKRTDELKALLARANVPQKGAVGLVARQRERRVGRTEHDAKDGRLLVSVWQGGMQKEEDTNEWNGNTSERKCSGR